MHRERPKQGQPGHTHLHPESARLERSLAPQTPRDAKPGWALQAAFLSYSSWVLRALKGKTKAEKIRLKDFPVLLLHYSADLPAAPSRRMAAPVTSSGDVRGARQGHTMHSPAYGNSEQPAAHLPRRKPRGGKGAQLLCTELRPI